MRAPTKRPRQLAHLGMDQQAALKLVSEVKTAFGARWLESNYPQHRIKTLWQRTDALASTELVTLGDAISRLKGRHTKWLLDRIRTIKANDKNCHGYIFEILGIAMMARTGAIVSPTQNDAPGIDAVVDFDDGFKICLSFKNHEISTHEQEFRAYCGKARAKLRAKLRRKSRSIIVFIDSPTYIDQRVWKLIHRHIDELPTIENQPNRTTHLGNGGQILTEQLKPGLRGERFSPCHLSDTFFVLCSWHKNEQNNLKDKLAKALANISKHVNRTARTANFVFLRLHYTADLNLIEKHAREILDDESRPSPLDGIILYQAAVTRTSDTSQVSHHMRTVVAKNYVDGGHLVGFAALIGVPSPNASRLELRSARGARKPISARYMFQAGDHYLLTPPISENPTFTISSVAPGLHTHAVIGGTTGMTLSGIFPSDDELLIL